MRERSIEVTADPNASSQASRLPLHHRRPNAHQTRRRPTAAGDFFTHFTAPTVNPSMNRSKNRLYRIPIGKLVMRHAAISDPQ